LRAAAKSLATAGSGAAGPILIGKLNVASSGTQMSLHTSQSTAAFKVTVSPTLASAGTVSFCSSQSLPS